MSTIPAAQTDSVRVRQAERSQIASVLHSALTTLASLRLAVVSFAAAIVIIFAGTLAQVDRDIWEVIEIYFKPWFTNIEVMVFFPRSWFPGMEETIARRSFAFLTLSSAVFASLMTLANSDRVKRSIWIAGTTMFFGALIAISSFYRGAFLFPGGALIGAVMCVNLLAAHGVRFKIQAKGNRLILGLAITALGAFLTWLVIASGHSSGGFQGEPPFEWTTLWTCIKIGLTTAAVGLFGYVMLSSGNSDEQTITKRLSAGVAVCLAVLSFWLWVSGESTYIGASGMRILWQLILGLLAGTVIWFGCILLFRRRSGVVVLHAGIGLMMFGQWYVSNYDVEEQITMFEGQAMNYGQDVRSVELAIIERNSEEFSGQDDVVVIPMTLNGRETGLLRNKLISDDRLPFDIEVDTYFKNSRLESLGQGDPSPATKGRGRRIRAVRQRGASGTSGSEVDVAAGYFRFKDKEDRDLGTYLVAQDLAAEPIEVGDKSYDAELRFVRNYKDYSVRLLTFTKDDYLGTSIARHFASEVQLTDEERGVDRKLTIWMNNPRRYAGETFYQSGWGEDRTGNQFTTLQVVRNRGWMIPYVSCMICMVGMMAHFSLVLVRFLNRQSRSAASDKQEEVEDQLEDHGAPTPSRALWVVPSLVVGLAVICIWAVARTPDAESDEMDLYAFGQLPVVFQGRVKPFDTLARNSLRVIADAETFVGVHPPDELQQEWESIETKLTERWEELRDVDLSPYKRGDIFGLTQLIQDKTSSDRYTIEKYVDGLMCSRQPATRWLLDIITNSERSRNHKVIRVYNPEVLDLLGLERRKRYRYALAEIAPKMDEFQAEVLKALEQNRQDPEGLSLYQRKVLEVDVKLQQIMLLHRAFVPPDLPPLPTPEEFENDRELARTKVVAFRDAVVAHDKAMKGLRTPPPLSVAPDGEETQWQAYAAAWPTQFLQTQFLGQEPNPSFRALNEILVAYVDNDVSAFNDTVSRYKTQLEKEPPESLQVANTSINALVADQFGSFYGFEVFFNQAAPFLVCAIFYVVAFGMLALGWLAFRPVLNRAAFWLLLFTFAIHTVALIARIYISGRPPVTNLYSSAVFIGWGAVLLALIIEWMYRNGVASVIAASSGFATLLIAHKLAGDGDTFQVLQAVLDTQFWLATHVVCITFGYSTTFLAGLLGALYILRGVATPSLDKRTGQEFARMIYGTLCFSILFSFIGTVLGGLWADDSWGRFWGWDPKENGALIIVLWNALILHARWAGLIKERGLAVLAVAGNVVTAWSWFGVNELGVGLHSYGFTEGRLLTLAGVIVVHLLVIAIGWLPMIVWWSYRRNEAGTT